MEFEKQSPSQFEEKWQEIIDASRRGDYELVDEKLVPELAENIESEKEVLFLFDRISEIIEPDWVVRDAAVAALNIDSVMEKVDALDMRNELNARMQMALIGDSFPWIPANAMNWLLNYANLDDTKRQTIIETFINQAETRANNPEEEFASQWAKPVLKEEVSFLFKIPEIKNWLEI